ncbi:hypothetical protein AB5J56_00645 [Streptomyces sp. R21]|uniref:Uncharacterized protein n=1 Tax=Streptomyces sp. R21 TaxID=3238627 RepID=A0AB39NZI9_9ACTN
MFQENTPLAIAVGVGLAFVVTGVIEGVRRIRRGKADAPKAARDLQPEGGSGL